MKEALLSIVLIALLLYSGCGTMDVDMRNGTYRRGSILMDKTFKSLTASVKDDEGESEMEIVGYQSEVAEVVIGVLELFFDKFNLTEKED